MKERINSITAISFTSAELYEKLLNIIISYCTTLKNITSKILVTDKEKINIFILEKVIKMAHDLGDLKQTFLKK